MIRRDFLKMLMAGAVVVAAGELWVPDQKLISIPSGKIYTGSGIMTRADFRKHLQEGLNAVFDEEYRRYQPMLQRHLAPWSFR